MGLADSEDGGVTINVVGPGTAAALATSQGNSTGGLQVGDDLIRINKESVSNVAEYDKVLAQTEPGDEVTLTVRREGKERTFTTTLQHKPLEVLRPEQGSKEGDKQHALSYLLTAAQINSKSIRYGDEEIKKLPSLLNENWEVHSVAGDAATVEFKFTLGTADLKKAKIDGALEIIKRYRLVKASDSVAEDGQNKDALAADAYHLEFEIEVKNLHTERVEFAYALNGPTGLPLEGWWYAHKVHPSKMFAGAGVRDVVCREFGGKHLLVTNPSVTSKAKKSPENPETVVFDGERPQLQYIAVDAQYFVSGLVADVDPQAPADPEIASEYTFASLTVSPVAEIDAERANKTDITFQLKSPVHDIQPNESYKQKFLIFAGPKYPEILEHYGLGESISYGWFPMVAKPLQWILHSFYKGFSAIGLPSYGLAIILLTVLVRGCMYPIGRQQARNAQKMQLLAPEMKRINELYKNDMEKRAAAQRELFQKNNYNPAIGCLPVFLQMPIFIGLYRALSTDILLRDAPLIPGLSWCSNLAGPDQLWYWEPYIPGFFAAETGFLGPYLNVLPLISVALMIVQQKMFTPPPTDEQQEMTMKMMKYMMVFIGFMFFKVPSGLCLYFITSSLWGVAERKLLPKPTTQAAKQEQVEEAKRKEVVEQREARKQSRKKNRKKSK
ncbi:MAG: YidC/Oxa1 family insertase periplasmic-domain containing protein [Pirellulaceae bacterium]